MNRKSKEEADESLRTVAFDVEEEMQLPLGYVVDELVSSKAKEFMRNVKAERKRLQSKRRKKEKTKDIEVNSFPDNNKQILSIYSGLKLDMKFIDEVKSEFVIFKQKMRGYCSGLGVLGFEEIVKRYKLTIEGYALLAIPSDSVLEVIGPSMSNSIGLKLVKKVHSFLVHDKENNSNGKHYVLLMWLYMLLGFIEMPLVDDDNAALYSLNKYLYQSRQLIQIKASDNKGNDNDKEKESIEMVSTKIVYIIISEIFKQKVIIG